MGWPRKRGAVDNIDGSFKPCRCAACRRRRHRDVAVDAFVRRWWLPIFLALVIGLGLGVHVARALGWLR